MDLRPLSGHFIQAAARTVCFDSCQSLGGAAVEKMQQAHPYGLYKNSLRGIGIPIIC